MIRCLLTKKESLCLHNARMDSCSEAFLALSSALLHYHADMIHYSLKQLSMIIQFYFEQFMINVERYSKCIVFPSNHCVLLCFAILFPKYGPWCGNLIVFAIETISIPRKPNLAVGRFKRKLGGTSKVL